MYFTITGGLTLKAYQISCGCRSGIQRELVPLALQALSQQQRGSSSARSAEGIIRTGTRSLKACSRSKSFETPVTSRTTQRSITRNTSRSCWNRSSPCVRPEIIQTRYVPVQSLKALTVFASFGCGSRLMQALSLSSWQTLPSRNCQRTILFQWWRSWRWISPYTRGFSQAHSTSLPRITRHCC